MLAISIIMPVYNGEMYIVEAIDSILKQTFTDFEFIIINDGSLDRSSEIIDAYCLTDNRIKYINRKENRQLPYTLNEGLKIARGKYIARMDCDDISELNRLEIQYNFLENNQEIGIIGSAYFAFNSVGKGKAHKHPNSIFALTYMFLSDTYFCHPSVMFRKGLIEKIGYYKNVEAEDFDFFSKLLRICKGLNLPQILIKYRETEGNRSFSAKDKINKSVEIIYKENYLFYFGSLKYYKLFYKFHKYKHSNIFFLPLNYFISIIIINKIRTNYHYSITNKEFLLFLIKPLNYYFQTKIDSIRNLLKNSNNE